MRLNALLSWAGAAIRQRSREFKAPTRKLKRAHSEFQMSNRAIPASAIHYAPCEYPSFLDTERVDRIQLKPRPKRPRSFSNRSLKWTLAILSIGTESLFSQGFDLDGDGLGDLWSAYYEASNLSPNNDDDGDGATNLEEEVAGTDPFDPLSVFKAELQRVGSNWRILWIASPGKGYRVETTSSLVNWAADGPAIEDANGQTFIEFDGSGTQIFARVNVSDRDQDGDGLTAWEEAGFFLSDTDPNSNGNPGIGDYSSVLASMNSSEGYVFNGKFFPGGQSPHEPLSLAESARFLQQATMGADFEMIQSVSASGIPAWIDAQIALPATSHVQRNNDLHVTVIDEENGEDFAYSDYIWTWWDVNLTAPDVLRQRVAFALSEILVVGQTTDTLEDNYWGIATYYDLLVNGAFGNYRDILYNITTNPAMGHYLSHVKNRPTDLQNNIFPDENYAREIMQLFSIGLWELNLDGSRKKDVNGNDIPTYDNSNITEFARVFTGLTYNPENPNNGTPWDSEEPGSIASIDDYLGADSAWMGIEMAQYEPMHETGPKNLLYGQSTDGTLKQDLDAAIDNLFNHPNVGPFIGRLLIQRLVKSNPSPGYVARVASAFNSNASGARGDMKAVIRAILLDPEARNATFLNDPGHGKLREPVIRHLNLMRAFNFSSSDGRFRDTHNDAVEAYAQRPMRAPSVFNFYLPDHQPIGELKNNGLYAPEFQITTATTTIKTLNYWANAIPYEDFINPTDDAPIPTFTMDYSDELALADDIESLIDRLDILLTRGQMTTAARATIGDALVSAQNAETSPEDLVRFAITLIASSPDFAILR